jgi:hypothetical protein
MHKGVLFAVEVGVLCNYVFLKGYLGVGIAIGGISTAKTLLVLGGLQSDASNWYVN